MIIDFKKLVVQLLPLAIRRVSIASLAYTLIAPIAEIYDKHQSSISSLRIKSACTHQVVWLERIVKHETNVDVAISEHDHKPFDFIVNIIRLTDSNDLISQVKAVIDRYKVAGKSYTFNDRLIGVGSEYGDFVCAVDYAFGTVQYGDFVCEMYEDEIKRVGISLGMSITDDYYYIDISAEYVDGWIDVQIGFRGSIHSVKFAPQGMSTQRVILGSMTSLDHVLSSEFDIQVYNDRGGDITSYYKINKS